MSNDTETKNSMDKLNKSILELKNSESNILTKAKKPSKIISTKRKDPANPHKDYLIIKLLHPNAKVPSKAYQNDAGYDLYAFNKVVIEPWQSALIGTQVSLALPPKTYGRIASRSSVACHRNLEVGAGVVDNGYRGEIKILMRNFSDIQQTIEIHEKIAQIIVTPYESPAIKVITGEISDVLGNTDRNCKGFGSSNID